MSAVCVAGVVVGAGASPARCGRRRAATSGRTAPPARGCGSSSGTSPSSAPGWSRRGAGRPLAGTSARRGCAVVPATVVGEAMHLADPFFDRQLVGAAGTGLDVASVVLAAGMDATLLRWRMAQLVVPLAVLGGAGAAVALGFAESASTEPRRRRRSRPSRSRRSPSSTPPARPSCSCWRWDPSSPPGSSCGHCSPRASTSDGGAVARVGPAHGGGNRGRDAARPAARSGRDGRWPPRRAAPSDRVGGRGGGAAATIVQPELGDAAVAVRRVAVGVGLVSMLGAAGGIAWFAADATTGQIVPGARPRPRCSPWPHSSFRCATGWSGPPTGGCSVRSAATPG